MKQLKSEKARKVANIFHGDPPTCACQTGWGESSQTRPRVPPKEIATTTRNNGRENSSSVWGFEEMRSDIHGYEPTVSGGWQPPKQPRSGGPASPRLRRAGLKPGLRPAGLWPFLHTLQS